MQRTTRMLASLDTSATASTKQTPPPASPLTWEDVKPRFLPCAHELAQIDASRRTGQSITVVQVPWLYWYGTVWMEALTVVLAQHPGG